MIVNGAPVEINQIWCWTHLTNKDCWAWYKITKINSLSHSLVQISGECIKLNGNNHNIVGKTYQINLNQFNYNWNFISGKKQKCQTCVEML